MPVPVVAAAVLPEVAKVLSAAGAAKDVCVIDGMYQPMVEITKTMLKKDPSLAKKFPLGEMPNPRWPQGMRVAVPAWMFVLGAVAGVSVGSILILEAQGKLGGVKEALGLKKKSGVFGLGFGGL